MLKRILFLLPLLTPNCLSALPQPVSSGQQDEACFWAGEICQDIAELQYFAVHQKSPNPPFSVKVAPQGGQSFFVAADLGTAGQFNTTLHFTKSFFHPANYRSWVEQAGSRLHAKISPDPDRNEEFLLSLTQPTASKLARLDQQLSSHPRPASAAWHEQAALLLVAFASREPLSDFFHPTHELARATAHLALARVDTNYNVALAALLALSNDQREGLQVLKQLPSVAAAGIWRRAYWTRITGDYRMLRKIVKRSPLEDRELFRAEYTQLDSSRVWKKWPLPSEPSVLLDRISQQHAEPASGIVVQRTVFGKATALEAMEAREVSRMEGWTLKGDAPDSDFLNQDPVRCVVPGSNRVAVLGAGSWGSFWQRRRLQQQLSEYKMLQDSLGVPEEAKAYKSSVASEDTDLLLWPLLFRAMCQSEVEYQTAQQECGKLIQQFPERLPASAWVRVHLRPSYVTKKYLPPEINRWTSWFFQGPLPGTAFDSEAHLDSPEFLRDDEILTKLDKLAKIAPYDFYIHYYLDQAHEPPLPSAKLQAYLQPVLPYRPTAVYMLVDRSDTPWATSKDWLARTGAFDPEAFLKLALRLRQRGDLAAAETALVRWMNSHPEPVMLANQSTWLVLRWEAAGRHQQAEKLAQAAAQVYSYEGIRCLARLLENRGQADQALEVYQAGRERYNDNTALLGFLTRQQKKGDTSHLDLLTAEQQKFPGGLTAYKPPTASDAPREGAEISATPIPSLREGDIIVALNEYAVKRKAHLSRLLRLDPEAHFQLTIFRDGKYLQTPPLDPLNDLGDLNDFSSR